MDIQYQQLLTIIIAPTAERLHVDTICFSFFCIWHYCFKWAFADVLNKLSLTRSWLNVWSFKMLLISFL